MLYLKTEEIWYKLNFIVYNAETWNLYLLVEYVWFICDWNFDMVKFWNEI